MKVVFTETALADLDDLLAYTAKNYPGVVLSVETRIRAVVARIARHPESARRLESNPDIRVIPLIRYPYKIFYQILSGQIEILHIHHLARDTLKE